MGEQDGTSLSQHLALLGGWRFSSRTALEEQHHVSPQLYRKKRPSDKNIGFIM
jgi:hypothetical protein